jgi:hypothetical protein
MNIFRASLAISSALVLLASSAATQPTMKFCEFIAQPDKYNGKLVKFRATWTYGFEWSYLHCLDCDARVWLDTSDLDDQSEKILKHTPKGAGIVNVDVEGVFETGRAFGHMGSYKYQLRARTVTNPAVLSKGMKPHEKELEIERQFGCGGTKPR